MPHTLKVEPHLIQLTLSGQLAPADFRAVAAEMMAAEAKLSYLPPRITEIAENTEWTIKAETMMDFVTARRRQTLPNPIKSAIVVTRELDLGFARMFQTLNDHPQVSVAIFSTREAALAWLDQP